jgi:FKBP-type peptidyl-prolyl cis-trans isomerase
MNTSIVIANATDAESSQVFACAVQEIMLQEKNRMTRYKFSALAPLLALAFIMASCSSSSLSDLKTDDIILGTGAQAVKGSTVTVHYTGWLYKSGRRGRKFDSSLDSGQPFAFKLGAGEVIEGWDRGIDGMRIGGKRELIIPAQLGYGAAGAPPDIPPDAILDFEVQLLEVKH